MPKSTLSIAGRTLTLDARPDRLDLRDLTYRPPVVSLDPVFPDDETVAELFPSYSSAQLVLDQGSEGACTGFGLAAVINYLLWIREEGNFTTEDKVSPRMIYHLARFYDEWPGEDYEGSSCRGALKGWHRHGVCLENLWPYRNEKGKVVFIRPKAGWDLDALKRPLGVYYRIDRKSVVDIQAAIHQIGAVYVSAKVHNGWGVKTVSGKLTHAKLPVIKPGGEAAGGHAFALVGYNDTGFIVQNSWGPAWGASGFAVLTYEDWVANGTDSWVVALGAPVTAMTGRKGVTASTLSRNRLHFVREGRAYVAGMPIGRNRLSGRPNVWDEQEAYWHTLVTGNDGVVINRLPQVEDEKDNARLVVLEQPQDYFKKPGANGPRRVVIYAHGGLNSEQDSIERIRILGPCFENNGVYPIFTTWKSGWLETIGDILKDQWKELFGVEALPAKGLADAFTEATDRTLEVVLRTVMVKAMWSEMKENAIAGGMTGRGIDLIADRLADLKKALGAELEIHLMGHSAGSFICGQLLSELRDRGLKADSCTLFAPACSVDFALSHYKTALEQADPKIRLQRDRFYLHLLSNRNELDDTVGPYQKSLLYLVSRALEVFHKTPILGLLNTFDAGCASDEFWHTGTVSQVSAWQEFFWNGKPPQGFADTGKPDRDGKIKNSNLFVLADRQVNTGPRRIKSSHGCFDNSITVLTDTIQRIIGGPLSWRITNLDY